MPEKSTHSINPVKHWWLEESSCGALHHYGQAAVHINTSPPTTARSNLQDALQLDQDLPLKFNALRTQEHDGSVLCMRRNLAIYGTAPPRYFCRYAQRMLLTWLAAAGFLTNPPSFLLLSSPPTWACFILHLTRFEKDHAAHLDRTLLTRSAARC